MAVVSQEIPSLINGISQQSSTQRLPSQAEDQENIDSSIVDGLRKRAPLEFIATLDGTNVFPNTTKFWSIQTDESNRFVVAFYDNGVKVYGLDGVEKTVSFPDGNAYLNSTNPKSDFNLVNIADFTFIANKSITPAADSTTTAAKVEEFLVYVKNSGFGREYKVSLTHPDMQTALGYGISVIFQMPTGSVASTDAPFSDTNKIADILLKGTSSTFWDGTANGIAFKTVRDDTGATLSTTQGLSNYTGITSYFTFEQFNSTIYGKPTDGDSNYTVTTSDGQGNTAMYVIRDEIQKFSNLPFYAKVDMIVVVTGDEGEILTDYYVKYTGDGVWQETVGPGVSVGLDDATMPHALINNRDGTFTFRKQTYNDRTAGDATSNPNPSFVGVTIQNLTFYKNRLGILAGENLILSGNAEFFNFFSSTVTDSLDTDPIDIAASGVEVNTLKNSVGFNETLLLFSDTTQYKLDSAGDPITPTTAILNQVSSFEHNPDVAPVSAGKFAYFAQKRNDKTLIREYFTSDDTLTNDGIDITAHVSSLIPDKAYQLISNTTEDVLIVLCSDDADAQVAPFATGSNVTATNADTMFVYKYFFTGDTRVQSGWSKWTFNGVKIIGAMTIESTVYVFAAEGTTTKLFKLDLQNAPDTGLAFNIALDLKKSVTGTYDAATDKTTFTSPYGAKAGLLAVKTTTGADYEATNTTGSTYTIEGNHTSLIIGVPYTSTYEMSKPYIRDKTDRGVIAVTSGRFQVRTVSFNYEDTGFLEFQITPLNRDTFKSFITPYVVGFVGSVDNPSIGNGVIRVPIQCRNTDFVLKLVSSSHLPFNVSSAELEGFYHARSTRV